MMRIRDLLVRVRALMAPRRVEAELDEELAFHIEREAQKHVADGLRPADARARALARFGPAALAADQCREARGTAFIDALARDVSYALRTFRRAPLAALTIVATIALGLGVVASVFNFYSLFFLRVDAVQSPDELFAVTRPTRPGADSRVPFTRGEYENLRRENSVFVDLFATAGGVETRIDGRPVSSAFVSGNFFQLLGVRAALGRTLTPGDDGPSAGRSIVLSHRAWNQLLGGDPTVIGRSVAVNGVSCVVVGVMPEDFRGLDVAPPEYWAPLALAREFPPTDTADTRPLRDVVGRLKPGISPAQATGALNSWASAPANRRTADDRQVSVELEPRRGTANLEWLDVVVLVAPMFFAFGLILMIGCANVANLLLARAISRQREIGIRLSIGASRTRVVRQLLTESFILALASAAGGFVVSRILLEGTSYAVTVTMPGELAEHVNFGVPAADWRVLVFLFAGAIFATALFGLAPALQATRVELLRATRGDVSSDARPGRARHALIAAQVGASALLLICAAVFLRSALATALLDPGFRTSDTIRLPIANEARRGAIVRAMAAHSSVLGVAAVSSNRPAAAASFDGAMADARRDVPVDYKLVSPGYFELLDVHLVRGRGFTDGERSVDAGVSVVSETAARKLWPNGDALGQVVLVQLDRAADSPARASTLPFHSYTVVGVARDVAGIPMMELATGFSGVYLPVDPQTPGTELILRVRGDPEQARHGLIESLTRIDPALDHEVGTMRTIAGMSAYLLQIAFWVTVALGALALTLTGSGLFSVLSYLVEQRAKEIGVRMALGATTQNIAALVLSQSLRPVGLGLLVGGGLAAALATALMSTPAAAEIDKRIRVFDPLAYAASLLVIVTACALAGLVPSWRAARLDPIETLRND